MAEQPGTDRHRASLNCSPYRADHNNKLIGYFCVCLYAELCWQHEL